MLLLAQGLLNSERMLSGALVLAVGQFVFFEVQPGITSGEEPAAGAALAFETGVGGAWRNSWPRFFLVTRYQRSAVEYTAADLSRRTYDDASAGLRLLLPVVEPVRVYLDLLAGATHTEAQLDRTGLPMLESERWRPLGQLALGVQVRPLTHFSFGVRLEWSWTDNAPDALALAAGRTLDHSRIGAAAVVGFHF